MGNRVTTFAEDFQTYQQNMYQIMYEHLAEDLGVTALSLQTLGAGFFPAHQVWVFAERDHAGEIIGLAFRGMDGRKWMAKKSKRGLIYPYNSGHAEGDKQYDAGQCHWIRIADAGIKCPICGKPDWCLVSSDYGDPQGASAAACSRIEDGSVREITSGTYLHILDGKRQYTTGQSVLPETTLPIPIVEGYSDVLAAMDLGFVPIGRPSARGGMEILKQMPIAGKDVWIFGENDTAHRPDGTPYYPGKEGMTKTFINVRGIAGSIKCILPPEGPPKRIKDLRAWLHSGLTQAALFEYVIEHGDDNKTINPDLFASDAASHIAKRFITECHTVEGVPLLRSYHGQWTKWKVDHYEDIESTAFNGSIWRFVEDKRYVKINAKGDETVVPYKATRAKISDIVSALNMWCPVAGDPPIWLDGGENHPNPSDLIVFKNGILNVADYMKTDEANLLPLDPRLFTYNVFPYNYDPYAWSDLFENTYNQIFNGDIERISTYCSWLGYNLVPDMSQEKLMIFLGGRRSGKGTLLSALYNILGKRQCCATTFQALAGKHGLSPLVGKLATILGDAKTPRKGDAETALETILQISGKDPVTVDPKYMKPFDIHLKCRFTVGLNELPNFSDNARAFVSRAIILDFPNSYVGREDFTLKDRLQKEAREGKLINHALIGLKILRDQGKFIMPESSKVSIRQLEEITTPIQAFVAECCYMDDGDETYIPKNQMFDAWSAWCIRTGRRNRISNQSYFGRWLKGICPRTGEDYRPLVDGKRPRSYCGIDLHDWAKNEYLDKPA